MLQIKKAREKQSTRRRMKVSFHRQNSKADRYRNPHTEGHRVGQIPKQTCSVISLISKKSTKELANMKQNLMCPCSSGVTAEL